MSWAANLATTASRAATRRGVPDVGVVEVDDDPVDVVGVVEEVEQLVGRGEEQLAGDVVDAGPAVVGVDDAGDVGDVGDATGEEDGGEQDAAGDAEGEVVGGDDDGDGDDHDGGLAAGCAPELVGLDAASSRRCRRPR